MTINRNFTLILPVVFSFEKESTRSLTRRFLRPKDNEVFTEKSRKTSPEQTIKFSPLPRDIPREIPIFVCGLNLVRKKEKTNDRTMKTQQLSLRLSIFSLLWLCVWTNAWAQADPPMMKIISYNILEGMKDDTTANKQVFAAWVRQQDPDILALQETNGFTQESLQALAESYGHPYAILCKEPGYPPAITSKYPIVNVRRVTDNMTHGFVMADIGGYHVISIHLNPHSRAKRMKEAEILLHTLATQDDPTKWIIMGDFNSFSPYDSLHYADGQYARLQIQRRVKSPHLQNLNNDRADFSVQSRILESGLVDVSHLMHKDYQSTFPTVRYTGKNSLHHRYDYIFVSKDLKGKVRDQQILRDEFTDQHSDHYPNVFYVPRLEEVPRW